MAEAGVRDVGDGGQRFTTLLRLKVMLNKLGVRQDITECLDLDGDGVCELRRVHDHDDDVIWICYNFLWFVASTLFVN